MITSQKRKIDYCGKLLLKLMNVTSSSQCNFSICGFLRFILKRISVLYEKSCKDVNLLLLTG